MSDYYILEGRKPKAVDLMTHVRWSATADRHVGRTQIGPLDISTVFLGLNHNFGFGAETRPILFETMIFGFDENDNYQTRCATWEEAERMHALAKDIAETLVREANLTLANFMGKLKLIDC